MRKSLSLTIVDHLFCFVKYNLKITDPDDGAQQEQVPDIDQLRGEK